jgi:hypothetical protein
MRERLVFRGQLVGGLLAALVSLGLGGCGPPAPNPLHVSAYHNLSTINGAYLKAIKKLGHPPKKREDLVPFLEEFGDPDEILKSPSDGQPYVIVWGLDVMRLQERGVPTVVAFEKNGKDGKRYYCNGLVVLQVNDEEFRKLPIPAAFKSSS